jgi:hypothetical protein
MSVDPEVPIGTIHTCEDTAYTAIFDRVIETSVVECFSARNVSLRPREPSLQSPEPYNDGAVLAFVGLFGQALTGTLLVAVRRELAEELARVEQPGVTAQTAYVDFMAELTNELLGRIKNLLVSYGVQFQLGLPKALACAEFWLHTIPGDTHRAHRFASPHHGDVCAWFDVVLAPEFVMIPPRVGDVVPCLKEGELLML